MTKLEKWSLSGVPDHVFGSGEAVLLMRRTHAAIPQATAAQVPEASAIVTPARAVHTFHGEMYLHAQHPTPGTE